MPKKLEHYVAIANAMVAVDKKRDEANKAYDRMDHNEWDLPSGLQTVQGIRKKVNGWERSLKWLMVQANRRRQGPVNQSFVKSALKYDEIVAQVVDLDYQIAQKDIFGGDTQREKAARRHYGRDAGLGYPPNDVHVRYSKLMPEAALLRPE